MVLKCANYIMPLQNLRVEWRVVRLEQYSNTRNICAVKRSMGRLQCLPNYCIYCQKCSISQSLQEQATVDAAKYERRQSVSERKLIVNNRILPYDTSSFAFGQPVFWKRDIFQSSWRSVPALLSRIELRYNSHIAIRMQVGECTVLFLSSEAVQVYHMGK